MKQNELRIEDEIKTFDDAVKKIGENHPLVKAYAAWMRAEIPGQLDLVAFLKLRIICAALNEGWQPEFTEDEARYYLWCVLWTEDELKGKMMRGRKGTI